MTYPNVLVMSYLESTGQLTPEWRAKLESAISAGWQRLLTFEVPGGGFDWYGRAPAKTILTAYGILELTDMAKVRPIDPAAIARAKRVLYSRQESDGSWALDVRMHTWHQLGNSRLPLTAYIVWALREAGLPDREVERGAEYVRNHAREAIDPYVAALCALALGKDARLDDLEQAANKEKGAAFWTTPGEGLVHARGGGAAVEATALATLALSRGKRPLAVDGLAWLARQRDPHGSWGSTQATILAMKALLEGGGAKPPEKPVTVRLKVNGKEIVGAFARITRDNFDVVQQAEIPVGEGENVVELEADGELHAAYQVAGRTWVPWPLAPRPASSPLSIEVAYDKTQLDLDEVLRATATMRYRGRETFMVILDLGIPPGFVPDPEPFERLVSEKKIDKYAFAGRQITVYLGNIAPDSTFRLDYTLRPKFPIVAQSTRSGCYEYYTPENEGVQAPRTIRVNAR